MNEGLKLNTKKKLANIKNEISKVIEVAQMENCNFAKISGGSPLPTSEADVTDFIKGRTDLFMSSWIVEPLQRIITAIENLEELK